MSPSGNKRKKNDKFFFTVWFPACTFVKALSISSYISSYHLTIVLQMYCTWEGKIQAVLAKVSFKYPLDAWFDL